MTHAGGIPITDAERTALVSMFTAYLEDLGRIGGRHEETRKFYLSLISALFVFLSLAGKDGVFITVPKQAQVIVGVVGILVCVAWFLHMFAFAGIFAAKRTAMAELEVRLPAQPLTKERQVRETGLHIHLTLVDRIVAGAFLLLFILLLCIKWGAPVVATPPT